jgi:hypothetical protein
MEELQIIYFFLNLFPEVVVQVNLGRLGFMF